jgi:poly(3-hydroxybutyrate) depolymerase
VNLAADRQLYHLQKDVGHYGVFNGSRFRRDIAPAITQFSHHCAAMAREPSRGRGRLKAVR